MNINTTMELNWTKVIFLALVVQITMACGCEKTEECSKYDSSCHYLTLEDASHEVANTVQEAVESTDNSAYALQNLVRYSPRLDRVYGELDRYNCSVDFSDSAVWLDTRNSRASSTVYLPVNCQSGDSSTLIVEVATQVPMKATKAYWTAR